MDEQQLNKFIETATLRMEGAGYTNISNIKVKAKDDSIYYATAYSTWQNEVSSNKKGPRNKIAQANFIKIMDNYYVSTYGSILGRVMKTVDNIVPTAINGSDALSTRQKKIIIKALSLASNKQYIDDANNAARDNDILKVQQALQAAAQDSDKKPKNPGELNPVAPNPQFLAELAAWANQCGECMDKGSSLFLTHVMDWCIRIIWQDLYESNILMPGIM